MASTLGSGRVGRFSDSLLDEIRAKADIVSVIGEYVQLKRRGSNHVGLCPFHNEKTPSFTVTPDKQMFYCFGCQTGGNVFTFLMKKEGLSFSEVVELLAGRAGVSLPEKDDRTAASPAARAAVDRRKRETDLLYRITDFASRFFQQALLKSPEGRKAREYLERRGVKPESVTAFRLGYAFPSWDRLLRALRAKGVDEAAAIRAGLALRGEKGVYDRFRGRLMFTICDHRGRPIGFGARALDEGDEPKYLNSPETPLFSKGRALYGLHLAAGPIRRNEMALVVEGYMDVIACHEHGFDFAVASMGTAVTPEQARALHRLTNTVVTAFDADAAGTQATLRGLEVLAGGGFPVKVARIPGGKDPDDCLRSGGGPDALRQAIKEALPVPEFGYWLASVRHDISTVDGRAAAARDLLPFLASIPDLAERQAYVDEFEKRLRLPAMLLRGELDRDMKRGGGRGQPVGRGRPAPVGSPRGGLGVRDVIRVTRDNKERQVESGSSVSRSLPRNVVAAERTLLGYMVRSEDSLHLVLAALIEAAHWCRDVGPGQGPSDAKEDAGAQDEGLTETEAAVLEWFLVPVHRAFAGGVLRQAREGPVDPARAAGELTDEDEAESVARIVFEAEALPAECEHAVRDCLGVLKEHRLNSRIEELHRRISELETSGAQVEEYAGLLRELIDLQRHTDGGAGHWRVPGD